MNETNEKFEPEIVAFCCHYCAYGAADLAGSMRLNYPANVKIVKLPCTGKVDILYLLKAFEDGADGVYVAGCLEGNCHFTDGNIKAKRRVARAKKLLDEIGLDGTRLEMYNMSASMGPRFAEVAREMTEKIKALGPSPLRKNTTLAI
ncbi:MAG: hydrogenase iron-sulfur subunit [bacterium]|nr:hydrogenase iron-sulfur subunit [bacterium]